MNETLNSSHDFEYVRPWGDHEGMDISVQGTDLSITWYIFPTPYYPVWAPHIVAANGDGAFIITNPNEIQDCGVPIFDH